MAEPKTLLFLQRRAPLAGYRAVELLEAALIAGAFDQEVRLAFLDDGVLQLALGAAGLSELLEEVAAFEPDHVWVERESLDARGLTEADLSIPVTITSRAALTEAMAGMDMVLTA